MLLLILYSMSRLLATKGSIVLDAAGEEEFKDSCSKVDYSKYCDQLGDCRPGAHVFCMFYTPGQIMGPHCDNGRMVRITNSTKTKVLEKLNSARAMVAKGNATGQNNVELPKAYGMVRLEWDSELALFGQVWANQCRFTRGDLCRATKRFRNPGQFLSVFRYTYPNWIQEDALRNHSRLIDQTKKCLTQTKVDYAIETSLDVLLSHKQYVSQEQVYHYSSSAIKGNNFLMILNGKATHVGCGLSAYIGYHWNDEWKDHNYYALQLVCNLSAKPIDGDQLYNVDPPADGNATNNCGCPEGYFWDDDCLCYPDPEYIPTTSATDTNATTTDATTEGDDTTNSVTKTDASTKNSVTTGDPATTSLITTGDPATTSLITTSDAVTGITTSRTEHDDATASDSENGTDTGDISNCVTNCSKKKQRVVVMPIFAVENAPQESLNIDPETQMKARNYDWRKFDKRPLEIAQSKKSIFTGVKKFLLPSTNENRRSLHNGDSVLLSKELKTFLDKVPSQERLKMEELFLKFVMKRQNHLIISTKSPLMRPVKKYQAFTGADKVVPDTNRNMYIENTLETNIEEPVYEKPQTPDDNDDNHLCSLKRTGNIKENKETMDENQTREMQSQLAMPIIRKQQPLVGNKQIAKYRNNNNGEKIIHKDYSKAQKSNYYNMAQNDIKYSNNARDVTHFGKNVEGHIEPKYINENKISNQNSFAADDFKVKRRDYRNDKISKLINKFIHLHRNSRPNYKNKKERFRPVMAPR